MNLLLKNRTVLITGGTRGIGNAMAQAFAHEGADVIICARSKPIDKMNQPHEQTTFYIADVNKPGDIENLIANIKQKSEKIDILINNVGRGEAFGSFFDLTDDDWRKAYDFNFLPAVSVCRAAVPLLKLSDAPRIINIAALSAHQPGFFNPHYAAAKAALLNVNKYMATFLAKDNILVNAICPSTMKGGGWEENIKHRADRDSLSLEEAENVMEQEESKKSPLGKMGRLEDVANLALFLASPLNGFITGSVIDVDGGLRKGVR